MPKLKTHKGMKKRFQGVGDWQGQQQKCGSSHLMSHKSGKQVRPAPQKSLLEGPGRGATGPPCHPPADWVEPAAIAQEREVIAMHDEFAEEMPVV